MTESAAKERGSFTFAQTSLRRLNLNLAPGVLLALCLIRLWLMPLTSSFWVDEMATVFVVRHGAADPSLRVVPQVPASVYYALPRLMDNLAGTSEIAYRLPSLLAMVLALFLIGRLAAKLIHPDAGWFAAFACLLFRGFNYQAADARPYALATCVFAAGAWFLVRWLDSARWRDALAFAALASLLWRVHLTVWPCYAVFVLYTLVRLLRKDTRVGRLRAAAVFAALGVSLIPVILEALALNREASAHVVVLPPTWTELLYSVKLGFVAACCTVAALVGRWLRWPHVANPLTLGSFSLLFGWWLFQPLGLFAFSWLTGNSVFVPRYLYVALPGVALAGTAIVALLLPPQHWKPSAAVLGLAVLLLMGRWNLAWPPHHPSDWRGAARALNAQSAGPDAPVLCPSPFVEAKPPVWSPDYPLTGFLYSHLQVYPLRGKVYPFPFESSPEAQQFAGRLSQRTLSRSPRFFVFGGERDALFWRAWFSARPELAGWSHRRLGRFGDVEVILFDHTP